MRLYCASANPKKVAEIARMLPDWVVFAPRPGEVAEPEETAPTLEGNAIIKAVEVANYTGQWAISDDTGLVVDALDGEPGVRSARFAGEHATDADNRALLLERMQGVAARTARFRTVIALMHKGGEMHILRGECEGTIADSERGDNGFGYDSVFVPADGDGRTFAEMSAAEKDALSHRARALQGLAPLIARIMGTAQ